jgi:hypothetical protein
MVRILTNLRIDEVSSVDRGAGEGVRVMLTKRNTTMSKKPSIFSKIFGGGAASTTDVTKATGALAESVSSILADDKVTDKGAALAKTFEQFDDHISKTLTAGPAVIEEGTHDMDINVLKKALGLADTATEADVTAAIAKQRTETEAATKAVAKIQHDLEIANAGMDPTEKTHHDALPTEEAKKVFRALSKADRKIAIEKAAPPVPEYVQAILAANADMKKQLDVLNGSQELVTLQKKAVDHGLVEADAEVIQKAYRGDSASVDKLLGIIKADRIALKKGGVFTELGTTLGGNQPDDAYAALMAKAAELRKVKPDLTEAQAFEKIYADPANAELVKKERLKNRPQAA